MANNINTKRCMNPECKFHGRANKGNIRTHAWYKTKTSRRRRYICNACGKSFNSNQGLAYLRLRVSREKINYFCHMSAEGVNVSAISRILGHSWNTINHWLERAQKLVMISRLIERLNLTIRRYTSYLRRKTPAHVHRLDKFQDQLVLRQCYYNFVRPHLALNFGAETCTPAMMAKVSDYKTSWAEVL